VPWSRSISASEISEVLTISFLPTLSPVQPLAATAGLDRASRMASVGVFGKFSHSPNELVLSISTAPSVGLNSLRNDSMSRGWFLRGSHFPML
jgi:hypothetical protein